MSRGRKRTRTAEVIKEQNRERARRFYLRNKDRLNRERMDRYWKSKEMG